MTPDFQISGFWPKILYKILKEKIPKIENFKNEFKQNLFLQNCATSDSEQKTKLHRHPKIISLASRNDFHAQICWILGQNPEF